MEKSIIKIEHCKVSKLLNNSTVSKFVTKIWNKINNSSSSKYSVNKHIRFKTSLLKSDLRDYSNAYNVVKETITVVGDKNAKKRGGKVTFKNNALFRSSISKTNNGFIDNAQNLDIVMPCVIC